jgi:hypothetical protein
VFIELNLGCLHPVARMISYDDQPDDGRTTKTCSYVYISNILTYDSDVA